MSKRLFERACKKIPGGVNSPVRFYEPYPFFALKAKGSKIMDLNHTYIDYCMGYGSMLLGHAYRDVIDSVRDQLGKGTLFCTPTEKEVELAELITRCVPGSEMVRLVNTGSEATMHAIRLARAHTGRKKIVKFEGCYHGAHDYVLTKAGSGAMHHSIPLSEGMLDCVAENTVVVPYNNIDALEQVMNDDIAAVIIEPVIANMGLILPEDKFLHKVRKITKDNGSLLIFDEVVTGFRLALGGAQEYYNIRADIATFAKAIANGFPIAAITGKKEVMERLAPLGKVYQASTFAGNPVSVTAALETLRILKSKRSIYRDLGKRCNELVKSINDIVSKLGISARVNSLASMFQIFFTDKDVRDYDSVKLSNTDLFNAYFKRMLKNGVFIPPSQFETCFISYSHNENDLKNTVNAIEDSLKAIA